MMTSKNRGAFEEYTDKISKETIKAYIMKLYYSDDKLPEKVDVVLKSGSPHGRSHDEITLFGVSLSDYQRLVPSNQKLSRKKFIAKSEVFEELAEKYRTDHEALRLVDHPWVIHESKRFERMRRGFPYSPPPVPRQQKHMLRQKR